MHNINIGLNDQQREGVITLLNQDLSDLYLLLIKTKKYHWDVVGPQFRTLHQLWEEQYKTLTQTIDACAERVRMLGGYPVGTMEGFLNLASIKEHSGEIPSATEMVSRLVKDHETIIRKLRQHVAQCSETFEDDGTADFLTRLMEQHEAMTWILRSFIEGEAIQSDGHAPSLGCN